MTRATFHVHHLFGCRPTPLAHYLKALATLRLIGQQADPEARGWWELEAFHLATRLDEPGIERFFLEAYVPTPLVAPWNGGSGFYAKDNRDAIESIEASTTIRFEPYRQAIASARALLAGAGAKPSSDAKADLIAHARRVWRGPLLDWLDAAIVVGSDGELAYPPMLGTGGNDGRLDFTNNYMQRLCSLFDCANADGAPRPAAARQLRSALFGTSAPVLEFAPVGMFLPGSGGGPNSGRGFSGRAAVNPWDYVLMLEGAICFSAAISGRVRTRSDVSSPFAVGRQNVDAAGHGTPGREADTRGEQWLPLWSRPACAPEVLATLREGRRQLGRIPAHSSTDMARAISRLGAARGISSFERYGYFERNGQAFVAVPLGRWEIREQSNQRLLDELHHWLAALGRVARDSQTPSTVAGAARRCQEAVMACSRDGAIGRRWRDLLVALGDAEAALARSRRFSQEKRLRGLPPLDPAWLHAATGDDDDAELRLAASLGSQAHRTAEGHWDPLATVRKYFTPLDELGRFVEIDAPLSQQDDLVRVASELVNRALLTPSDCPGFPLIPAWGAGAPLAAVEAFLDARIDDGRVLSLLRTMMAIDWRRNRRPLGAGRETGLTSHLMAFGLVRLAYSAWPLGESTRVSIDPAVLQRLRRGDLASAVSLAAHRLRISGLRPLVITAMANPHRLAASLAFGLDSNTTIELRDFVVERPSTERTAQPNFQEALP